MHYEAIAGEVKDPDRIDLAECMSHVAREFGKSVSRQLSEIAGLAFTKGKLAPREYYYYRLYEDGLTLSEKREFVGAKEQTRIIQRCNPLHWWSIAHDKLICYAVLQELGFPTPRIEGVYHATRTFGKMRVMKDSRELVAFLSEESRYPLFAKPVTGVYSLGSAAFSKFAPDTKTLWATNGEKMEVDAFAKDVTAQVDGYLFQELLQPHPALRRACGPATSTIRLIIMNGARGPELLRSLWKIAASGNVADNFWRSGNLLADIDLQTGRVVRVVSGYGPSQKEVEVHPDTGEKLKDIRLPDWNQILELSLASASAFSGLRLQAWDVAITETGPVLVEVNIGGDFNLPQVASGRGMLDSRFKTFLSGLQ